MFSRRNFAPQSNCPAYLALGRWTGLTPHHRLTPHVLNMIARMMRDGLDPYQFMAARFMPAPPAPPAETGGATDLVPVLCSKACYGPKTAACKCSRMWARWSYEPSSSTAPAYALFNWNTGSAEPRTTRATSSSEQPSGTAPSTSSSQASASRGAAGPVAKPTSTAGRKRAASQAPTRTETRPQPTVDEGAEVTLTAVSKP